MNERDLMQALQRRSESVQPAGAPIDAMTSDAGVARRRRTAVAALASAVAVAVVVTAVSVIGLGGDRASAPDVVSPGDASSLAGVLAVLPEGTRYLDLRDRAAAASRLGLDESSSSAYAASVEALLESNSGTGDEEVGGLLSPLSTYFNLIADLPVNDYHVMWSVTGSLQPPSGIAQSDFTVYHVSPDTDLDALVDGLVDAGLVEDDVMGRRHVAAEDLAALTSISGLIADTYPLDFGDVTIDTDADLLITGSGSREVLEVLDGLRDSLGDSGTLDSAVGDLDQVERASVVVGAECDGGAAGLERPDVAGWFVHGADAAITARLGFPDEATAATDLTARRAFLESGPFGNDKKPGRGDVSASQDGTVVDLELAGVGSEGMARLTAVPGNILGC